MLMDNANFEGLAMERQRVSARYLRSRL